jgi:hypothetical protein
MNDSQKTVRIALATALEGNIRFSPPMYLDNKVAANPSDLTNFAPQGNGVYGYQNPKIPNPFKAAPSEDACGGVIYFENSITKEDFYALMRILRIQEADTPQKDYAVYLAESESPGIDGYLSQMRLISRFGLQFMFGTLTQEEFEAFPEQSLTMVEALWAFIEAEKDRWGTSFGQDKEKGLRGLFGGDGDFAREELCFGLMLENNYNQICRIWSRAWLVTK